MSEYLVKIKFEKDDLSLHILYQLFRKIDVSLDRLPITFEEFIGCLAVIYAREIDGMIK